MIRAIAPPQNQLPLWLKQPKWAKLGSGRSNTASAESMTFAAGAVFAMLDALLIQEDAPVPMPLLGNKLALKTAEASLKLEGRFSSAESIRDAYYLTPPDSDGVYHWGPDGDSLSFWRQAVNLRINNQTGIDKLKTLVGSSWAETIDTLIEKGDDDVTESGPLVAASHTLRRVLDADDRSERIACLMADIVIARAVNWEKIIPVTTLALSRPLLRALMSGDEEAALQLQMRLLARMQETFTIAQDLAKRAAALRKVEPKLRAKTAGDAVELFLTEEAVAASGMLSPVIKGTRTKMTSRAARRLCDRLVELGVARELTGRPTFRLYGI